MEGGFLGELGPKGRAALETLGRRRWFESGAPLFVEGDVSATVMIVYAGRVKVVASAESGYDTLLALRGPGEILGDLSAIDGHPRSATGTALERVDVQVIAADDFRNFLADTPGAGLALLRVVIARMRDSDRQRVELGARDTLARVAMRLLELATTAGQPTDEGVRIAMQLTQDDLAGWVAASREGVARALASLRRRGLITTGRREITVIDLEGLRAATH
jgi:CRP-like cAMP-binding protein